MKNIFKNQLPRQIFQKKASIINNFDNDRWVREEYF